MRLEPGHPPPGGLSPPFQFHKGAIRTTEEVLGVPIHAPFQFHKGAIRTALFRRIFALCSHFNSIKVRLELYLDITTLNLEIFQFHKGAIRTRKVLGVDVLRIYGFVGAKIQKNLQKNVDA